VASLPETVSKAWDDREGPIVFSTVDEKGTPNSIYASCVSKFGEDTLVVADNFFCKTKENILAGSKGSILFITKDGKSCQVKGSIAYQEDGKIFDAMKSWNPDKLPGHAAAALKIEEAYAGAEKLL